MTTYPAGVYPIEPVTLTNTRGYQAHVHVLDHTDPAVTIRVDFDVSTDGGQTWAYGGGFTTDGQASTRRDKNGALMVVAAVYFGFVAAEQPPTPERLVKGTLTITGGSVSTQVDIFGTLGTGLDKSLIPVG